MYKIGKGIVSVCLSVCMLAGPAGLAAPEPAGESSPEVQAEALASPAENEALPSADTSADVSYDTAPDATSSETAAPIAAAEVSQAPTEAEPEISEAPSASASYSAVVTAQWYNPSTGVMEIRVSRVPTGSKVVLAAWPGSDTDAVREYTAYDWNGSTLIYRVPITDFCLRESWYTFEARCDGKAVGSTSASMYFKRGKVSANPTDETENKFELRLNDTILPGYPRVWFIVTDTETGRRGLHQARQYDDSYVCTVPVSRYGHTGKYKVNAIASTVAGMTASLGQTEFVIHGLESSKVEITDIDGSVGTFAVRVEASAPSGIKDAVITIWSQEDESDRFERTADEEDGAFIVRTGKSDFSDEFGTYYARAEVTMGNGIKVPAGETQAEIEPRNFVVVESVSGSTSRRITVVGPDPADASQFKILVRPEGASDGGKELSASSADDGTVYATLKPQTLNTGAGTYIAYAIVNGKTVGSAPFELSGSDFVTEAEARIAADCQRVYNRVGTDLHANYMWVVNNFSYVRRYGHLTPPSGYTRGQWYAVEGLEKQSGNCYTFAAAFCELAKGLGYNARYVEAEVWGPTKGWQPHGIVLVYRNGGTYICDPELQFASSKGRNLYMQPVSNAKAKYRW